MLIYNETAAEANFHKLLNYNDWQDVNIKIELLGLKNNQYELQVAIPHILTDVVSFDLFNTNLKPQAQFQDYILQEQTKYKYNLQSKITFWQDYFQETELLKLPLAWLDNSQNYSVYLPLATEDITKIISYKNSKGIVLNDIITAAVIFAVSKVLPNDTAQNIILNQVLSTRFDHRFDNTMGCFLRLDPIKVIVSIDATSDSILAEVQQQNKITAHFQETPALLKLSSLPGFVKNKNKFLVFFMKIYSNFFKLNDLERTCFLAAMNLRPIKGTSSFFININIGHNVFSDHNFSTQVKQGYYDWIKVDNCLDVSLVQFNNQPHIVVSANLRHDIKNKIAQHISDFITNLH